MKLSELLSLCVTLVFVIGWINKGTTRNDLQKLCAVLANNKETPWVNKLNSQARQSAADRAWQSINRFYQNCHAKIPGKKGFPRFEKA
jgi:putative transposase